MKVPAPLILISSDPGFMFTRPDRRSCAIAAAIELLMPMNSTPSSLTTRSLQKQHLVTERICLVLRFLMFYNPVALLVSTASVMISRGFVTNIAISLPGSRLSLVSGLVKILKQTTAANAPPSPEVGQRFKLRGISRKLSIGRSKQRLLWL